MVIHIPEMLIFWLPVSVLGVLALARIALRAAPVAVLDLGAADQHTLSPRERGRHGQVSAVPTAGLFSLCVAEPPRLLRYQFVLVIVPRSPTRVYAKDG